MRTGIRSDCRNGLTLGRGGPTRLLDKIDELAADGRTMLMLVHSVMPFPSQHLADVIDRSARAAPG